MLFNSYSFLFVFAPLVYSLYWAVRRPDARKYVLVLSSYVFYGVWSAKFALLMLATTSVDYFTAQRIEDGATPRARRAWLWASLLSNLGVLGVFKYYNFFASSLRVLLPGHLVPLLDVALPIGISFYTFESMSYTIDVYRRKTPALRRFIDYAHFVTMFPRLIAGPIVRYADLRQQLEASERRLPAARALEAAHFFTLGLAKKVLIADPLAVHLVDPLFARSHGLGLMGGWAAALGYTAQLYFDFSGYSDMAVGLAKLLGLELPRNFLQPYRSGDIGEFWRRWHVSLSSWLRDYLYISLGGNRRGPARRRLNQLITMLLGGLWHGASWTFVAWGAYHGVALALNDLRPRRARTALDVGFTFLVVVVGWVLFRAPSLADARAVYQGMVGLRGLELGVVAAYRGWLWFLGAALALSFAGDTYDVPPPRGALGAALLALLFVVCVARLAAPSPFLYFQF